MAEYKPLPYADLAGYLRSQTKAYLETRGVTISNDASQVEKVCRDVELNISQAITQADAKDPIKKLSAKVGSVEWFAALADNDVQNKITNAISNAYEGSVVKHAPKAPDTGMADAIAAMSLIKATVGTATGPCTSLSIPKKSAHSESWNYIAVTTVKNVKNVSTGQIVGDEDSYFPVSLVKSEQGKFTLYRGEIYRSDMTDHGYKTSETFATNRGSQVACPGFIRLSHEQLMEAIKNEKADREHSVVKETPPSPGHAVNAQQSGKQEVSTSITKP